MGLLITGIEHPYDCYRCIYFPFGGKRHSLKHPGKVAATVVVGIVKREAV
jgi:hypothetical protein